MFFVRREENAKMRHMNETSVAKKDREARQQDALNCDAPIYHSKVYEWIKVEDVWLDAPEQWRNLQFRAPVYPGIATSIWRLYPRAWKSYSAEYDEWDLWTNPGTDDDQDDVNAMAQDDVIAMAQDYSGAVEVKPFAGAPPQLDIDVILEDIQRSRFSGTYTVSFPDPITYRRWWYGYNTILGTAPNPRLDKRSQKDLAAAFGMDHMTGLLSPEEEEAAQHWVNAIRAEDWSAPVLESCWDLRPTGNLFMMRRSSAVVVKTGISVEPRTTLIRDHPRVFLFRYSSDDPTQTWSLLITAPIVLFLMRRPDIRTSRDAVACLLGVGAAFNTVVQRDSLPAGAHPKPATRATTFYRHHDEMPDARDYPQYRVKFLELIHQPHARVALMMGGIVWRLTMEFMSESDALWQHCVSLVMDGPTEDAYYQPPLTAEGDVDDGLSQDELNTICGLYKVYTGKLMHHSLMNNCEELKLVQKLTTRPRIPHGGLSSLNGLKVECTPASGRPGTRHGTKLAGKKWL